MTLNDWKDELFPQEVEALEDFGYTVERYGDREISQERFSRRSWSGTAGLPRRTRSRALSAGCTAWNCNTVVEQQRRRSAPW